MEVEGGWRIERKAKPTRREDIVNIFTRRDSWQMAPNITKISLSPNLPELGISMNTMGGYYTMGNYIEGRLTISPDCFPDEELLIKVFI
jgi:hypothetical protein